MKYVPDFENIELKEVKETVASLLYLNRDKFFEFLSDQDSEDEYGKNYSECWVMMYGLLDFLKDHEDKVEQFLDQHDLWGELHAQIVENENDKEAQAFNS